MDWVFGRVRMEAAKLSGPYKIAAICRMVHWDRKWLVIWWPALLVGHLEEEEKRELLDIVAVRQAVIAKNITIIPEFLDQGRSSHVKGCGSALR